MVPKWRLSLGSALGYPVFVGIRLFASSGNHPATRVAWSALALNALTMIVALVVCTMLHEAAHAVVARALGFSVQVVFLGRGPVASATKEHQESIFARVAQTDLFVPTQRWSEAVPLLRGMTGDARVKRTLPDAIPMIGNNLAWTACMLDDPTLVGEADRMSEFALTRSPDHPALNGTRGLVLIGRGLLDEARERLMFAYERNQEKNKALNACYLAVVHARKGDRAEANALLDETRQLDPQCYLLTRSEAAVSNA